MRYYVEIADQPPAAQQANLLPPAVTAVRADAPIPSGVRAVVMTAALVAAWQEETISPPPRPRLVQVGTPGATVLATPPPYAALAAWQADDPPVPRRSSVPVSVAAVEVDQPPFGLTPVPIQI